MKSAYSPKFIALPPVFSSASMARRVVAYLIVLLGYLFYCYNFNLVDYIRPYLVSDYGFTLTQTATFSVAANIGITIGALCWAGFIAQAGLRRSVFVVAASIGTIAVLQALSTSFSMWFGLRGLMAAALGGYYVVATGLVVAMFPPSVRGKLIALNSATYPLSNILLGTLGGALGDENWHILVWLAAVPLLVAPIAFFLVPSQPKHAQKAAVESDDGLPRAPLVGGWKGMLSPQLRWITIGCVVLSGIDFNAYQLFASFMTLYMKQELGYDAAQIGATIAMLGSGSLMGGFFWAWLSDRYGRRSAAFGYVMTAATVLVFLFGGFTGTALNLVALAFGVGMSCTSAWGVWFAELFPEHLRPYGASLFHAGHAIAMGAPIFFAFASPTLGLQWTMASAAVIYVVGAALWLALPETLGRERHHQD